MCIYETSMWPVTIRQGNWWYWAITSWSRNVSGTVYYHAMVSLFHKKMWRKKTSKKLSKWNLVYFGYFGGRSTVGDVCLEKKILAVQRRFKGGSLLVNYKNCPIVLNLDNYSDRFLLNEWISTSPTYLVALTYHLSGPYSTASPNWLKYNQAHLQPFIHHGSHGNKFSWFIAKAPMWKIFPFSM